MGKPPGHRSEWVEVGGLAIDLERQEARVRGRVLPLRKREVAILSVLAARAGRLVTKAELWREVFCGADNVRDNVVEVYVSRLRRHLPPDAARIRTFRGQGYLLVAGED
jgi:two-component system response regulator TctD